MNPPPPPAEEKLAARSAVLGADQPVGLRCSRRRSKIAVCDHWHQHHRMRWAVNFTDVGAPTRLLPGWPVATVLEVEGMGLVGVHIEIESPRSTGKLLLLP